MRHLWRGWSCAAAAAMLFWVAMPLLAADGQVSLAWAVDTASAEGVPMRQIDRNADPYRLIDTRLEYQASWRIAQAAGTTDAHEGVAGKEDRPHEVSASELNKQLSNPVTSLWSLTLQFNNFRLENGEWNNNLLFQPVLPISLTKDLNLINRPVIPFYDVVPHETLARDQRYDDYPPPQIL
jgi:hypothetical protein